MVEVGSVVQIDQIYFKMTHSSIRGIPFIVEDIKGELAVLTGFRRDTIGLSFLSKSPYKAHRNIIESNCKSNYLITVPIHMLSVVGEKLQEVI